MQDKTLYRTFFWAIMVILGASGAATVLYSQGNERRALPAPEPCPSASAVASAAATPRVIEPRAEVLTFVVLSDRAKREQFARCDREKGQVSYTRDEIICFEGETWATDKLFTYSVRDALRDDEAERGDGGAGKGGE